MCAYLESSSDSYTASLQNALKIILFVSSQYQVPFFLFNHLNTCLLKGPKAQSRCGRILVPRAIIDSPACVVRYRELFSSMQHH